MSHNNINAQSNFQLASFGQFGFRRVTPAFTPIAGEEYRIIYSMEVSTITVVAVDGDDLTALEVLPGTVIYGLFTSVSCSAGSVLAYIG